MASYFFSRAFINNLLGALKQPTMGRQTDGPGQSSADAGVRVTDERSLQVSAVYGAIRIISTVVAGLPLGFHIADPLTGARQSVEAAGTQADKDLERLVTVKPNRQMSAHEFRTALTAQLAASGNGFARIGWSGKSANARPINLFPLQYSRVEVYLDERGDVIYRMYHDDKVEVLTAKDVLHLKIFSFDGLMGMSPMKYGAKSLGISIAADTYAASSFAKGGRPLGTLTFSEFLTVPQREAARQLYQSITEGAENSQNHWVLEGGAKYGAISLPPDELQMLQTRAFQIDDIARFFGVPSHLLNSTEKSTTWGTGLEQQNRAFVNFSIDPYLNAWETKVPFSLMTAAQSRKLVLDHDMRKLLRGDLDTMANVNSTYVQNGILTRNEVRAEHLNKPGLPGGDELTVQVNLTPADQLGAPQNVSAIG